MRTKIYLDGKMKADLPGEINADKFFAVFRIFYFEDWKKIEIKKEEKKHDKSKKTPINERTN